MPRRARRSELVVGRCVQKDLSSCNGIPTMAMKVEVDAIDLGLTSQVHQRRRKGGVSDVSCY